MGGQNYLPKTGGFRPKQESWNLWQFCLHYPENTHIRINTGACRPVRTSKPVYCKISVRLQGRTKIQHKSRRKLSTTLLDTKTQNHFVKKRERTPPPAEISCDANNLGAKVHKNWLAKD